MEFASVGVPEQDRAFATLVMAFTADPFVRWIYPEAISTLPTFLRRCGHSAAMPL
jgi:hypothetical protein